MRVAAPRGFLRKSFEFAGVVPLAVFVVVHVVSYAGALLGRETYGVTTPSGAWMIVAEGLLVWLPLTFHALVGVWLSVSPLELDARERRTSVAVRVTGLFSLLFIALHAAWFRAPLLTGERAAEDVTDMLAARLSATTLGVPLVSAFHLAGLAAVTLHLGLAVPRFVERWGLGDARVSRRAAAVSCAIVFLIGAATVVEFATGSAIPRFLAR